jgi:hypothetical protein
MTQLSVHLHDRDPVFRIVPGKHRMAPENRYTTMGSRPILVMYTALR